MNDINQEVNKEAIETKTNEIEPVIIETPEIPNGEPLTLEQTMKITLALSKLFESTNDRPEPKTLTYEFIAVVDPAHVCMIKALNKEANLILSSFYQYCTPKIPTLDYNHERIVNGSLIAFDYLQKVLNVFKAFNGNKKSYSSDAIQFKVGENYPLTISNDYFVFLVAPRIGE